MLNDKGPLMFINTVNTQVNEIPQQKVYDSRKCNNKQSSNHDFIKTSQNSKVATKETDDPQVNLRFLEERKLNNIIDMYNKNRPVLCNIICEEKEVVGIPYKKDDEKLFVKTSEDLVEEVELNKITDIVIIKF